MFKSVFLNSFVMSFVCGPTYVNVAHLVLCIVCVKRVSCRVRVLVFTVDMTLPNNRGSYTTYVEHF